MPLNLSALDNVHSWRLERLSTTTYPQDITLKIKNLTPESVEAIHDMMRSGCCYRCRIGLGRYHFGRTAEEAAKAAVDERQSKRKRK